MNFLIIFLPFQNFSLDSKIMYQQHEEQDVYEILKIH